ncbi:MAG TPA: DegT/DnrJ/EryC1/StrS family aminotransferase [Candidatus Thermoplasmatota archaeon]|nr:DegT/DnrJ/EryC1/StrS family aminotransferase [Candidatus Thermoplasmatota archaeon]
MSRKVPLLKMYADETDVEAVSSVIRRHSYWATGPEIDQFEKELAAFIGTKHAVVFNSGTSALHAMLLSFGIQPNDEVVIPSFTFVATANCLLFVGAKPVFADIEGQTYGLDVSAVKKKITKKTKAIMPIHFGGCVCAHIQELKELAEEHDLLFFEDAAQSLGAKLDGTKAGLFGNAAMFSFCQDKIITTGEGGVIVTNDYDRYEDMKLLVSHGRADDKNYFSSTNLGDYIALGYNFRMPTMNAALGLSQLKHIDQIIQMRQRNAANYSRHLQDVSQVKVPQLPGRFYHVFQKYTIEVEHKRDDLQKYLTAQNIISKAYFGVPVHLTRFYQTKFGYRHGLLPETEHRAGTVLTLPSFPELQNEDIEYITEKIKEYFR